MTPLEQLVIDGDWKKYAKHMIPHYIIWDITALVLFLGSLLLIKIDQTYIVFFGYIGLVYSVYSILFYTSQIYYFYRVSKDPDYQENKWSRMLYGGK